MSYNNIDESIHVMKSGEDVWNTIKAIAESGEQEEAFYVCDIGDIIKKHKEWKLKLPRVQPYYAVKCNDSLPVIEVLAALGTSFDCASKDEIDKVLSVGVDPGHIIFANPAKPLSHIRYASSVGVDLMTFDCECELKKIKALCPAARLVIRIRCDSSEAQCQLGKKFGCDPESEAPFLMRLAEFYGLEIVGVSFQVSSCCRDPDAFRKGIAAARPLFDLGSTLGFSMNVLDVGGGFPGDKDSHIDKVAEIVNKALAEYFPGPEVNVIAEPGRYYVASAYTLATNIHSKKEVVNQKDCSISSVMYYINDGVYGSFNSILYDKMKVTPIPLNADGCELHKCSIWGPSCDDMDKVVESALLPMLNVGDWIVFENMGAYTLPMASEYNGFPVPKVYTVIDDENWKLLRELYPVTEEQFEADDMPDYHYMEHDLSYWSSSDEWSEDNTPLTMSDDEFVDEDIPSLSIATPLLQHFTELGTVN